MWRLAAAYAVEAAAAAYEGDVRLAGDAAIVMKWWWETRIFLGMVKSPHLSGDFKWWLDGDLMVILSWWYRDFGVYEMIISKYNLV